MICTSCGREHATPEEHDFHACDGAEILDPEYFECREDQASPPWEEDPHGA